MLIFLSIIVDFGFGINNRVIVTNAARDAARYGATGQPISAIQARAIQQTQGLVKDPNQVVVTFNDVDSNPGLNPGDSVNVLICYNYKVLSPIKAFANNIKTSYEMNADADMRMESVPIGATATTGAPKCP